MLVGDTYSSKTSSLSILKLFNEKVDMIKINPKSVNITNLYGYTDLISSEWTDGLLTVLYKLLASN